MYVPSIGQREGVAPTWNRLKQTLVRGSVRFGDGKERRRVRRSRHAPASRSSSVAPLPPHVSQAVLPGSNGSTNSQPLLSHGHLSEQSVWVGGGANRGIITCCASISATESANIILRNALGKVAANLKMLIEMADSCETATTVVDLFIDEGHRIGAYYLYKGLCLAFYVCVPRHHALKLVSAWLKKMNTSEGAKNTSEFDKLDLFGPEFLDDKARHRSEIRLLEMIRE
jgi:hypothetical protein